MRLLRPKRKQAGRVDPSFWANQKGTLPPPPIKTEGAKPITHLQSTKVCKKRQKTNRKRTDLWRDFAHFRVISALKSAQIGAQRGKSSPKRIDCRDLRLEAICPAPSRSQCRPRVRYCDHGARNELGHSWNVIGNKEDIGRECPVVFQASCGSRGFGARCPAQRPSRPAQSGILPICDALRLT